jgi:hypothetical protein
MDYYIYKDLNEVPLRWRTYKGARLSLEQINNIISFACENPIETETGDIPNYAAGREELENTHEILKGFWILKMEGS